MRRLMTISALAVLVANAPRAVAQNAANAVAPPSPLSAKAMVLHDDTRRLWADHVVWTRLYVIGAVGGDPSASVALSRLMKNQEDIANAIRPFYGDAAAAQLTTGANPNWPQATLVDMLNKHLTLTAREATDRIKRNWTEDQMTFDQIFSQAMDMADALSAGIIAQFPTKV
jgi:hypothetical protein